MLLLTIVYSTCVDNAVYVHMSDIHNPSKALTVCESHPLLCFI